MGCVCVFVCVCDVCVCVCAHLSIVCVCVCWCVCVCVCEREREERECVRVCALGCIKHTAQSCFKTQDRSADKNTYPEHPNFCH